MSTEALEEVKQELAKGILEGSITRDNLEAKKNEVCSKHSASKVPRNSDILEEIPSERREEAEPVLRTTPVRTKSGVSPVAVMTSPAWCPHGKCTFCPGGPGSEYDSPMSYTGKEPASMRGEHNNYDPYLQVNQRLNDLRETGHLVDKVELILMGGTLSARPHDYQEWFVKRCLQAMNRFRGDESHPRNDDWTSWEEVEERNERGDVRNIGTTFETKPDWCGEQQIDRMLRLGGTKVEVGVQTLDDDVLKETHRGHSLEDTKEANKKLRDSGFKVGFHMMPGMPGRSVEDDLADFEALFGEEEYRPDYLKIYPTLVVKDTGLYEQWRRNEFEPLTSGDAATLVARIKDLIPEYTRLSRVQRDIPATEIQAGVQKSNLRQLARKELSDMGGECRCIRCREAGLRDEEPERVEIGVERYRCADGEEFFIQLQDPDKDILLGFLRLRYPDSPHRDELEDAAILRELHIYGDEVGLNASNQSGYQHSGFGEGLVGEAEKICREGGFDELAVISGIGVREYYRKLGYSRRGAYMVKEV